MIRYLLRRLLQSVIVLFIVSMVVFAIARLSGDPVTVMLPIGAPTSERHELIRELGLDRPLPVQYFTFATNALRGNLGESIRFHAPALSLVADRLPNTVELAVAAVMLALVFGIPLGIFAALNSGGPVDHVVTFVTSVGQSIPSFWLGILLILFLGVRLGVLPIAGNTDPNSIIMPAVSLAVIPLVAIIRLTRSSMIDVLRLDFVRTAHAKGLRRATVVVKHVLPNGLIPVITYTGVIAGQLLGGAVITEQIFAWPGIGQLAIQSIGARDFAVVQTITLLTAAIVIALNLLVDFSYFFFDPRVREAARA